VNVVETRVHGLVLDNKSGQNVVILRETEGERILPIWIGPGEALAIQRLLADEPPPRPFTHDLLVTMVEGLKAKITRIVISELRESTFFAHVYIERDSDVLSIDARPSDSIAIALRAKAPIYVNDQLLQDPPREEAVPDPDEPADEPDSVDSAEQLRRYLEGLNPEDFGKFQP
jgi:bifunctional DNase/RNase